jgi:hypothetical protein
MTNDIISIANDIAYEQDMLNDAAEALSLLIDTVAAEMGPMEDNIDEHKALCFAARFPVYLSTFCVVARDVRRIVEELGTLSDRAFAVEQPPERSVQ